MKLTVLEQYGKGLVQCEAALGEAIREQIERLKWSLWHGQVDKALGKIDDLESSIDALQRDVCPVQCNWSRRSRRCARIL